MKKVNLTATIWEEESTYVSRCTEQGVVKRVLAALLILPLDDEASIVFGALSARLRSGGRKIGEFDEVIASIALACDREIVTRDGHFREVAGLVVAITGRSNLYRVFFRL